MFENSINFLKWFGRKIELGNQLTLGPTTQTTLIPMMLELVYMRFFAKSFVYCFYMTIPKTIQK